MDNRLKHLTGMFLSYVEADRKAKELQLAETRLVKVRQELDTKYGHYSDVRHRAVGVLQAVDAGLVTHETIQSTTEDVMMAAPGYWLAPALVALAGWIRDDRDLAERAVGEALRRDMDKTSLLFALVLRRYERRRGSALWLRQFLARQDPTALHREFVVILDAVATGAFGPEAKAVTSETVEDWLVQLEAQSDFFNRQQQRWQATLVSLTPQADGEEYPLMRKLSSTWPALESSICAVRRNDVVIDHFRQIFKGELNIPRRLEDQIDDMLTTLVARFDTEELPLRRQEAELTTIVELKGDVEAARRRFAATEQALLETVDFPTLLTNAAMHAEQAGASQGTQRFAVAMSRDWVLGAHEALTATARGEVPAEIEVSLEGWEQSVGEESDHDALAQEFSVHMDVKTEERVAAVKFTGGPLAAAIGSVAALVIGIASGSVVLIVAAVAGAIYAGIAYRGLDRKREAVREAAVKDKQRALEELKGCLAEIVDYREEWGKADQRAEEVRDMLLEISVSQYELSRPEDARGVMK
ncbi:MAG: hypothetical protein ACRDJ3_05800 [Solirubrobacteraceae bacterium]